MLKLLLQRGMPWMVEVFPGLQRLKCLELSDTEVGSNDLLHLSGLVNLESINLSFTGVTDGGLRKLSGLSSLKSLNLDSRQITDAGLAALTSMTVRSAYFCSLNCPFSSLT
ncbi:uncharacterized protein LOC120185509 [Hibiscus syriacus]|uniref:uncharacterized protein LOC120185509 n=1 Tax=Hibiscus syriacus TaxID=106335 RepID=UPI0019213968|nr:uncharacterized protein LOC120185509 [Hibiscus syriacus]XP_039045640.1 uncharacterized protein LOC120185509 [Hibiscus syriacus]